MNARVALPLMAAVSFALTCGVLLWNRRDGTEIPAHAGVQASDPAPTSPPLPPSPALAAASVGSESPAVDSQEMPVQFSMRSSMATNSYVGTVVNTSLVSLMIDVAVFSPQSHQTQSERISIEGGTLARFGVDDGLVINAGDRITLRSGGYREIVDQLPRVEPNPAPADTAAP
jgi:hypothetical protein